MFGKVSRMPDFDSSRLTQSDEQWSNPLEIDLSADRDLVMEQILENISNTPVGQVLNSIAALPEMRREKVLHLRQQITEGRYDLTGRLEVALDKVLEDLTSQI
jgi:anti-sigma28 factor (negative regulator of flagellin synthesis)